MQMKYMLFLDRFYLFQVRSILVLAQWTVIFEGV